MGNSIESLGVRSHTIVTLNGFPVLARAQLPDADGMRKNRSVVLVDRGAGEFQRWVTAVHCEDWDSWLEGHYISSLHDAIADFGWRWRNAVANLGADDEPRRWATNQPDE